MKTSCMNTIHIKWNNDIERARNWKKNYCRMGKNEHEWAKVSCTRIAI